MWPIRSLCILGAIAFVSATGNGDKAVFRKCCPINQSLVKLSDQKNYTCVDSASIEKSYDLVVSDSIMVDSGFPQGCDELEYNVTEEELKFGSAKILCSDLLVGEIINEDVKCVFPPKTVVVACKRNNTENVKAKVTLNHFRKCCPFGQGYDTEYHLCRDIDKDRSMKWLLGKLSIRDYHYIYDVEEGLHCKSDQFSIELIEGNFTLDINGSRLNVLSNSGRDRILYGDWCADAHYGDSKLVARICTPDCTRYGAYCIRKCCPLGQHYQPYRCGSSRSHCVPNKDDTILFNVSSYLDPLRAAYNGIADILGIREGLQCVAGRFALNNSLASDRNWLTKEGTLAGVGFDPHEYCLETFDLRACPGEPEAIISPVACFVAGVEEKNFLMAAVANTVSAVSLMVTLLVYCCLPELRNLHGRTLICHVSTMLLAYSCLARPQYHKVDNQNLCIVLGYGIYFGFVGAFFWLNVMCFDIWWTFGNIRSVQPMRKAGMERRRFVWYSLYAWGSTVLLTLIMYLCDIKQTGDLFDPNIGKRMCWFGSVQNSETDWPHYIFFVIPMGVVTGVNLVLWVLTARHCARVKSEVHRLQAGSSCDRARKRFRVDRAKYIITGKLWVVMGACWFSELLSTIFHEPPWLWAAVDLINELQGLSIFLILVFKPKVYHLIRKRLGLEKPDSQKNGASSSARTSSTFLSRTISSDERTNMRTSFPTYDVKRA